MSNKRKLLAWIYPLHSLGPTPAAKEKRVKNMLDTTYMPKKVNIIGTNEFPVFLTTHYLFQSSNTLAYDFQFPWKNAS
jgi:hypothetical protein